MKKKLFPITVLLTVGFLLVGCASFNPPKNDDLVNSRFGRCAEDVLTGAMLLGGNSHPKRQICDAEKVDDSATQAPH